VRTSGLLPDRALRRVLGRGAFVTAVLFALLLFRVPYFGLALRLWMVSLAAILVWEQTGSALKGWVVEGPRRRSLDLRRWRRPAATETVRGLEELQYAVEFSLSTAFDFHFRLRPRLIGIAGHRLAARGVELESQPERAREMLGEEAWELLRPDRPAPERRNSPGLELDRLRRVVERLDAL
jgi:hypothetical protein